MRLTKNQARMQAEWKDRLKIRLPQGSILYVLVYGRNCSSMAWRARIYVLDYDHIGNVTYDCCVVAANCKPGQRREDKYSGQYWLGTGCGFSRAQHVVEQISYAVWGVPNAYQYRNL